jgi:hypothetical protein
MGYLECTNARCVVTVGICQTGLTLKFSRTKLENHKNGAGQGSFFRLHVARKHPKKFPCYKRYKNSRIFLDEKAKYQPWIIKKKPKFG